jgi:hypothetical protein
MRPPLAWALAAMLLAAGGAAAAPPPAKAPPRQVFISPSGEPFRQGPDDPDPLKAWFDQADTGHLGYLDRAEFRADAVRFFKKLDENGDGTIDGFEVADYESKIVPELAEWASGAYPGEFGPARGEGQTPGPGQGQGQGHESHGGRHAGQPPAAQGGAAQAGGARDANRGRPILQLINEPEPVSGADYNLDSHITFDEWMRATDQRFDILDADKTGHLTLAELRIRLANPPLARKR